MEISMLNRAGSLLVLVPALIIPLVVQATGNYKIYKDTDTFLTTQDIYCMALNIYHESRSENLAGKFAVADVVMNRVKDRRYPDNVCGVIYDAELKPSWKDPNIFVPVRNRCQFSWYCDGKPDTPLETDSWNESMLIAHQIIHEGRMKGITEGATHYHTIYIEPYWASSLDLVGNIGSHIFYRER